MVAYAKNLARLSIALAAAQLVYTGTVRLYTHPSALVGQTAFGAVLLYFLSQAILPIALRAWMCSKRPPIVGNKDWLASLFWRRLSYGAPTTARLRYWRGKPAQHGDSALLTWPEKTRPQPLR